MFSILTEQTCGEPCWTAAEDICRCSCGGRNHGVLRRPGGERPERTAKIDGHLYQLIAVGNNADLYMEARRINEAAPKYRIRGGLYEYTWRDSDKGAPARKRAASKAEIARWPELSAWRGLSERELWRDPPYLLWRRLDDMPQRPAPGAASSPPAFAFSYGAVPVGTSPAAPPSATRDYERVALRGGGEQYKMFNPAIRSNPPAALYQKALDRFLTRLRSESPGTAEYNRTRDEIASLVLRAEQDDQVAPADAAALRRAAGSYATFTNSRPASSGRGSSSSGQSRSTRPDEAKLLQLYRHLFTVPPTTSFFQISAAEIGRWWDAYVASGATRADVVRVWSHTWDLPVIKGLRTKWLHKYGGTISHRAQWDPPKRREEPPNEGGYPGWDTALKNLRSFYLNLFQQSAGSAAYDGWRRSIVQWWADFKAAQRRSDPAEFERAKDRVLEETFFAPHLRELCRAWEQHYGGMVDYLGNWTPPQREQRQEEPAAPDYKKVRTKGGGQQYKMFNPRRRRLGARCPGCHRRITVPHHATLFACAHCGAAIRVTA